MESGIYQVLNLVSGKRYIGSSTDIKRRWRRHFFDLRHGCHHNLHLQCAFDKYGEQALDCSVLELVKDVSQLIAREQHYLDTLRPEYNVSQIAESPLGCRRSSEMRARMSEAVSGDRNPMYGKHHSEETKRKISETWTSERKQAQSEAVSGRQNPNYGKHPSEKTRKKLSEALKGRQVSEEHCRKISEARRGIKFSEEHRRKIGEAKKGKSYEEIYGPERAVETRKKISDALKAYWRRMREIGSSNNS